MTSLGRAEPSAIRIRSCKSCPSCPNGNSCLGGDANDVVRVPAHAISEGGEGSIVLAGLAAGPRPAFSLHGSSLDAQHSGRHRMARPDRHPPRHLLRPFFEVKKSSLSRFLPPKSQQLSSPHRYAGDTRIQTDRPGGSGRSSSDAIARTSALTEFCGGGPQRGGTTATIPANCQRRSQHGEITTREWLHENPEVFSGVVRVR